MRTEKSYGRGKKKTTATFSDPVVKLKKVGERVTGKGPAGGTRKCSPEKKRK